jgi:hypothetical protein
MGHPEENLNLGSDPAVPSSSQLHQALAYCTRSLGPLIGIITEHGHVLCIFGFAYYFALMLSPKIIICLGHNLCLVSVNVGG